MTSFLCFASEHMFKLRQSNSTSLCFFVIAVGQVNIALQLGPEEFEEKYGAEMPQQTDNIVFSCLAGIRSKNALDTATSLGYKEWDMFSWTKSNEKLSLASSCNPNIIELLELCCKNVFFIVKV